MKTSIWITTVDDRHIELFHGEHVIEVVGMNKLARFSMFGYEDFDIIQYPIKKITLIAKKDIRLIYKGNSIEQSQKVKNKILKKLKEKSDLLQQRWALRKMKCVEIQYLIDNIEKQLRNEYFEIKMSDILAEI